MEYISYRPEHRDVCITIFRSNIPKFFAEHELWEFEDWLDTGQTENYFVAMSNNEIVGCGGIYVDDENQKAGFAWGMIHSDHHRKGYGSEFSTFRIARIKEITTHDIFLVTSQYTFEFYRKLGFEVLSIEVNGFCEGLDKYDMKLNR